MAATQDKLFGKKIVIIGGTSGIGFGVAKAVLSLGARVVISSSNAQKVKDALQRLESSTATGGGSVEGYPLGSLDEDTVKAFFDKIGAFDHLIYTAGDSLAVGALLTTPVEQFKKAYDVRVWGAITAVKTAHPHLNPHGSIILTGGVAAYRPSKDWSVVASGAGALQTLTRGLAVDLAPIRVNLVEPGAIRTELWNSFGSAEVQEKVIAQWAEKSVLNTVGEPADTAEAYIYLMKAEFVTGTSSVVDGGFMLK
ncbi:hypothetical protein PLICRDRAFT_29812 [Plicaturopsis crispa FD-325 SS-3]|nr:hypothetical protein PLICRDRAFT_29812 [Plicaturopsis crispa FD-325 SS-3]